MGIISGLLGNASEINQDKVVDHIEDLLIDQEDVIAAYKLIRDLLIVTSKRLLLVNKQGITAKKTEFLSIPFAKISRYSLETAGHFDLDSEVKIWVHGLTEPYIFEFKRGSDIKGFYRAMSKGVL